VSGREDLGQVSGEGRQAELSSRLREAREYLGLAQQFVSDQTGIPRMAISLIENGRRRVDALELERLAALYRHPVAYFLGTDEDVPDSVRLLAREAGELNEHDREEVLKFARFLRSYRSTGPRTSERPEGSS
jgi:transcriptional regulator with XRE-family HTH domain